MNLRKIFQKFYKTPKFEKTDMLNDKYFYETPFIEIDDSRPIELYFMLLESSLANYGFKIWKSNPPKTSSAGGEYTSFEGSIIGIGSHEFEFIEPISRGHDGHPKWNNGLHGRKGHYYYLPDRYVSRKLTKDEAFIECL